MSVQELLSEAVSSAEKPQKKTFAVDFCLFSPEVRFAGGAVWRILQELKYEYAIVLSNLVLILDSMSVSFINYIIF